LGWGWAMWFFNHQKKRGGGMLVQGWGLRGCRDSTMVARDPMETGILHWARCGDGCEPVRMASGGQMLEGNTGKFHPVGLRKKCLSVLTYRNSDTVHGWSSTR
jgi:hypothetical protein